MEGGFRWRQDSEECPGLFNGSSSQGDVDIDDKLTKESHDLTKCAQERGGEGVRGRGRGRGVHR